MYIYIYITQISIQPHLGPVDMGFHSAVNIFRVGIFQCQISQMVTKCPDGNLAPFHTCNEVIYPLGQSNMFDGFPMLEKSNGRSRSLNVVLNFRSLRTTSSLHCSNQDWPESAKQADWWPSPALLLIPFWSIHWASASHTAGVGLYRPGHRPSTTSEGWPRLQKEAQLFFLCLRQAKSSPPGSIPAITSWTQNGDFPHDMFPSNFWSAPGWRTPLLGWEQLWDDLGAVPGGMEVFQPVSFWKNWGLATLVKCVGIQQTLVHFG